MISPATKRLALALPLVVALAAVAPAHAQQRDYFIQEQQQERDADACEADPECVAAMRRAAAREAQQQAAYERKSFGDKVEGWVDALLLLGGVIWLYTWLFSRGKKKRLKR